jgi:hypothetical protein
MNALVSQTSQDGRRDPSSIPWPPTLPVEIALRQQSPRAICEAYGIDQLEWDRLRHDPLFVDDVKHWIEELRKDGMSFKAKARLQAEELLQTSWNMIHKDPSIPHAVKADLIKFTIRAAGLDGSKDQAANAGVSNALQINIVMG